MHKFKFGEAGCQNFRNSIAPSSLLDLELLFSAFNVAGQLAIIKAASCVSEISDHFTSSTIGRRARSWILSQS